MKDKIAAKYQFKEIEKGLYDFWIKNEFFKAGKDLNAKPYTIVIPPPNVTGKLHLGHAWDTTLQDIIVRRKRMQGLDALYLPGMDHAGIATQAKIDERLKSQGISRYDLGREKYLVKAWQWKDEYASFIKQQWKALGLSLDYSKERFTLDEKLNEAVNEVFIKLYEKGLIYRGWRIINWDVEAKTALSNIEVEHIETQGKLYYFKYPLIDGSGFLTIATTRPETMFADQALMVHPDDKRYKKYVGKEVYIPGTKVAIPIIADEYVDKAFGTGVVKVTPAHDPNDFEVGKRHQLLMPLCMEENGLMNQMSFQYEGLTRFDCRQKLTQDLEVLGLVEKIEDYTHQVGYSERTGVMVEPRLSLQWFVKMDGLADQVLKQTKVKFYPERFKKIFDNWLNNIQDWTISRQLWWGHRIPAWYYKDQVKVQVESPGANWKQDEDVLDTWFSSALWPFSTLGWPDENAPDFKRYYPTDVLVTGYDIIFFWVARMMFQGLEFTGKDPFDDVLLHGLIRDAEGKKMSKSSGNGVDPMDIIEKHGIDALRYFLTTNSAPGADLRYDEEKVESAWNFINKLWNITRFVSLNIERVNQEIDEKHLNLFDQWILSRLSVVIKEADVYYDKYEFGEAAKVLYNFIWDEFASWYLELSKVSLQSDHKNQTQAVLLHVLKAILKLMHPFVPFATEKLYQTIFGERTITISKWPEPNYFNQDSIDIFDQLSEIIVKVRNLRNAYNVAPSKSLDIYLSTTHAPLKEAFKTYNTYLVKFLNTNRLELEKELVDDTVFLAGSHVNIHVVKSDLIDLEAEKQQLLKQKEHLEAEIKRSEDLLSNQNFISKAPQQKLTAEKEKYNNYKKQYKDVVEILEKYV